MTHCHYRVVISYKGSNYFGWQDLGDAAEKPTVQFEILQVLRKISRYKECVVSGASRTDAGVHALGQVAKLSLPVQIDANKLLLGMNSLLPDDIRIRECATCLAEFNPNKNCISKVYRYYFSIGEIGTPLLHDIVAHFSVGDAQHSDPQLALDRMHQACKIFIGEHDFCNFAAKDENAKSTIRTVIRLELLETSLSEFGGDVYCVEIEGNGFLRHMVRYILGALFEVGRGNIDSRAIEEALARRKQSKLSGKVKSRGLHLIRINY